QVVLDNPTCFTSPFQFEITFECLQELDDDLEWKVLYVGSAQDMTRDQILDEILVGPVPVGWCVGKILHEKSRSDCTTTCTTCNTTCTCRTKTTIECGWYTSHESMEPVIPITPQPSIPNPVPLEHIQRQILADKPRVTKFPISW
ncbi:ASF1-like protein, partial [Fragilariopsis cylindrus CCMP1102]